METLIFLAVVSYPVYSRARANHQPRWLWVFFLWFFVFAGGVASSAAASILMELSGTTFETESRAVAALKIPTLIGMFAGAVFCFWLVGRQSRRAKIEELDTDQTEGDE